MWDFYIENYFMFTLTHDFNLSSLFATNLQGYLTPLCLFLTCLFRDSSCFILTLRTRTSHSDVFIFTMNQLRSLAVDAAYSQLCKISYPFMFNFNISLQTTIFFTRYSHWDHWYLSCLFLILFGSECRGSNSYSRFSS